PSRCASGARGALPKPGSRPPRSPPQPSLAWRLRRAALRVAAHQRRRDPRRTPPSHPSAPMPSRPLEGVRPRPPAVSTGVQEPLHVRLNSRWSHGRQWVPSDPSMCGRRANTARRPSRRRSSVARRRASRCPRRRSGAMPEDGASRTRNAVLPARSHRVSVDGGGFRVGAVLSGLSGGGEQRGHADAGGDKGKGGEQGSQDSCGHAFGTPERGSSLRPA
ncbi:MAG: hypothetical protein QOC55_2245, partial [Thermoleophilaceae bacterium]|nr:hypothetical protein [Thermoleophilaceae bacterium]